MHEKRYQVLEGLPAYGPMYVPIAPDGIPFYSEGFVVRFFQSNGTSWVANFGYGLEGCNAVYDYPEDKRTVVFAGGRCYLMADDEQEPTKIFGFGFSAVFQTRDKLLIAVDQTDVALIDVSTSTVWTSDPISLDGFKDLHFSGDQLTGLAYEPTSEEGEWRFFSFNYQTKKVIGGAYYPGAVNRPWWKIW